MLIQRPSIMTITADLRPVSPPALPGAIMSNPDLTKLYMSTSCPELKAESVISSSDEEEENCFERFEPLMETHDENCDVDGNDREGALGMDVAAMDLAAADDKRPPVVGGAPALVEEPVIAIDQQPRPELLPSISSLSSTTSSDLSTRRKLQWEFKGLTIWLELEEFDRDLTRAVEDFSSRHSSPFIPKPHTTAIYGMEHLSAEEAAGRLRRVKDVLAGGVWPAFAKPTGVTSDIAVCGRPGQVCSIAWSELTLATNDEHEAALDALYQLFYGESSVAEVPQRHRPWKPHNSIAYDNPETNALSLLDTVIYASKNPTLLGRERRVEAISLWSTEGKMEDWCCIDRVKFW